MKLIVEMELPTSCAECPVCDYEEADCLLAGDRNTLPHNGVRPSWCPIKGVLPEEHGDLIDRDALRKYGMMYRGGIDEDGLIYVPLRDVMKSISNAPTIIAAERKDDGTTVD